MYSGVIYVYESPSHKFYIGQTMRPRRRKSEHKTHLKGAKANSQFHRAISKYGFDSFSYRELFHIQRDSKEELQKALNNVEKYLIRDYKKAGLKLYNATEGGDFRYDHSGEHLSEERKNKIRQWSKNFHNSMTDQERKEYALKISEGKKKPIVQYTLDGHFVAEWPSLSDVPFAKQNTLSMCLTGRNKTAYGYKWKYKEK